MVKLPEKKAFILVAFDQQFLKNLLASICTILFCKLKLNYKISAKFCSDKMYEWLQKLHFCIFI